jgi:hypothetical protein
VDFGCDEVDFGLRGATPLGAGALLPLGAGRRRHDEDETYRMETFGPIVIVGQQELKSAPGSGIE